MPTQLNAPTNVTKVLTSTPTGLTISWDQDLGTATATQVDYLLSFLKRDDGTIFTPTTTPVTVQPGAGSALTTTYTPAANTPDAQTLNDSYSARVIAQSTNPANFTDSDPGLETFWSATGALVINIGSTEFTISPPSGTDHVYRLPVSAANPAVLTLNDLNNFRSTVQNELTANNINITIPALPTTWPDGTSIAAQLNLSKLAIDTQKKLFALEVSLDINFTVFPGLKLNEARLQVLRTNGVDLL